MLDSVTHRVLSGGVEVCEAAVLGARREPSYVVFVVLVQDCEAHLLHEADHTADHPTLIHHVFSFSSGYQVGGRASFLSS
jgi:hypothetical protein